MKCFLIFFTVCKLVKKLHALHGTGTFGALFPTTYCRGHEPSLYIHKYITWRYFVHPVTATDVIYIILITIRSTKYVSRLLWIELTVCSTVLLEKLTITQLIKNFMEPEGSLLHSQLSTPSMHPHPTS